jgi:hypothetical protein
MIAASATRSRPCAGRWLKSIRFGVGFPFIPELLSYKETRICRTFR